MLVNFPSKLAALLSTAVVPSESNSIRCSAPVISATVISSCKSKKVAGCRLSVLPCSLINFRTAWKSKQHSSGICFKALQCFHLYEAVIPYYYKLRNGFFELGQSLMFQTVTDSRRRANTGHAVHPNGSPRAQESTETTSRGTFPSALVY